jgi:hypothetical protein
VSDGIVEWPPARSGFPWNAPGITGLPSSRAWDVVRLVELALADDVECEEARLYALPNGRVVSPEPLPELVLERLAATLDGALERPYVALARRRDATSWSVGARAADLELLRLPELGEARHVSLAVGPGGDPTFTLDGEDVPEVDPVLGRALEALRAVGAARHDEFVVAGERIGLQEWAVTVDPL